MNPTTAIEACDLSFGYENQPVLTDLSFAIGVGELVALIGPNGSGKTTLLKLLLGLLAPKTGQVSLHDRPLPSYPAKERAKQIAYVSQQPALTFPMTAFELVSLGRYPHASRFNFSGVDVEAVDGALQATDAGHLKHRRFNSLSGGEKQKILIARALAQSAQILLLDEPTLHLDLYYQLQILAALKGLCKQQRITVITVLHDVNLTSMFADKALFLSAGKLRAFGPVNEIVTEDQIKTVLDVNVRAMADAETGIHYFVPRMPR
ncbi:MAG TPA: ABC transporter ATP-binding protein [Terriglobales bacterium]|jgi:iron complex transport system ATP-binding protein|nr:ABC transporter ATP-binding protein [Terriglobales bacterium]